MKVRELMTVDVATTTPETLLKVAALELASRRISGMPVVDEAGRVIGVVSEADILAKEGGEQERDGFLQWFLDPTDPWVAARFNSVTVGDAMSWPAKTISPQAPVVEAATTMLKERSTGCRSSTPTGSCSASSAAATSSAPSHERTRRSSTRSRRT